MFVFIIESFNFGEDEVINYSPKRLHVASLEKRKEIACST